MPQPTTDERSRWPKSLFTFPESVFNLPGIRVHLCPESVFTIVRNTQPCVVGYGFLVWGAKVGRLTWHPHLHSRRPVPWHTPQNSLWWLPAGRHFPVPSQYGQSAFRRD